MKNTQILIHQRNYVAFTQMLSNKGLTPEREQLIREELQRNEDLYLKYSEEDSEPMINAGMYPACRMSDKKIEYVK